MPPGPRNRSEVTWVAETGSTNADVLALARAGAPEGTAVVADHQTAGRGRLGRRWQAPAGSSLLVTVLLRPPPDEVEAATTVAALAMAEAVEASTGVRALLKWPNDLTVDDRKLAGVLAEADWRGDVAVAVGIGVNCNWPPPEAWPQDLQQTMVSLNHLTGADVDRDELLDVFLGALPRWRTAGRQQLVAAVRRRSATLGRRVRVDVGDGAVVEGEAVDVDARGHLVVREAGGATRTFAAGDVTHLRHEQPRGRT